MFINNNISYNSNKYPENINLYYNKNRRIHFGMKENFFAKSRNGHFLKDTFDKAKNCLDICSNGLYPSNVLSNLAHKPFIFDGVECESIEGFLQSLKIKDIDKQKEICKMRGGSAKKIAKKYTEWLKTQILYWKDKEFSRNSKAFLDLIKRAFQDCYNQSETFKTALDSTKGIKLTHTMGKNDKTQTILTADEFTAILTEIRDKKI